MKRTFQPSRLRRVRTPGFLSRMSPRGGRRVLKRRRATGRTRPAVWDRGALLNQASDSANRIMGKEGLEGCRRAARFPRRCRLGRRRDFLRVQAEGKKLSTPHFGVCLALREAAGPRLGLVVGRKVGRAVHRNRLKRLLREFFRRHQWQLTPADIIIRAKKGAATLTYAQVAAELGNILLPRPWVWLVLWPSSPWGSSGPTNYL